MDGGCSGVGFLRAAREFCFEIRGAGARWLGALLGICFGVEKDVLINICWFLSFWMSTGFLEVTTVDESLYM